MIYYQQPAQYYAAPQRMMYVHYMQPSLTHARSTQAASALVAGETVATGTYLKDCNHAEADLAAVGPAVPSVSDGAAADDDEIAAAGAHVASSVAEAYPEPNAGDIAAAEIEASQLPSDDAAKVPRDYQFKKEQTDGTATNGNAPEPVPLAPIAPVEPPKRYLPAERKKKVYVELEQPEETQQREENAIGVPQNAENDDDEDTYAPAKYPNRRPVTSRKPNQGSAAKPLPAGTFFPIDFGGTSGGAIAIANSFSTGEGGSATSHAVAYGSPDAVRARGQIVRRH